MKKHIQIAALAATLFFGCQIAQAEDEKFDITRFDIRGNSLLRADEVARLVAPYTGKDRVYGDIQRALEVLEAAYRAKGYGTVTIYVPEQEIKSGVVQLQVTEAVIGKVTVTGNQFYSEDNVRASLPLLKEGSAPNLSAISDNVQLANENPGKHTELTLGVSEEPGKVDARVSVADEKTKRVFLSLDNTGDEHQTGQHRFGVAYRDANVFGRDEVFTFGYIMSPDEPSGVDVEVYTVGLRMPFYKLGDSLDVIAAHSSVSIPANVVAPGGVLALNGQGDILAIRWNNLFPRQGEYSSRMVYGLDYKSTQNPCEDLISAGCVDYLETPVSATYIGQWQQTNTAADFNVGLAYNPTWFDKQEQWRYNYAANARATDANFLILRAGGSYLRSFAGDWQVHGVLTAQYSGVPLPTTEQLGLAGAFAVRGFSERVLTADSGYVGNLEGYTPDLAPILGSWMKQEFPGTLRALVFYDWGYGDNTTKDNSIWSDPFGTTVLPGTKPINQTTSISSAGFGVRYSLRKDISAKFDWARVLDTSPANRLTPNTMLDEEWRAHFSMVYGF